MSLRTLAAPLAFAASLLLGACATPSTSPEALRDDVRGMAKSVIERLHATEPKSRDVIARSAGYAVFTNFGLKLFLVGGGNGEGVAVERATGRETFMKMIELQAGLGFGAKKFDLVFVFDTKSAFDRFVESGWEFGTQATAAAQLNEVGMAHAGALSISPGVWLYQLAGDGLALELTAKGTKYYKDDRLN